MKKNPFNELFHPESFYTDLICHCKPEFSQRHSYDERIKKHFMNLGLENEKTAGIIGNIKIEYEMKPQFEEVKLELKPRSLSPEDIEIIRKAEDRLISQVNGVLGMVCLSDMFRNDEKENN